MTAAPPLCVTPNNALQLYLLKIKYSLSYLIAFKAHNNFKFNIYGMAHASYAAGQTLSGFRITPART